MRILTLNIEMLMVLIIKLCIYVWHLDLFFKLRIFAIFGLVTFGSFITCVLISSINLIFFLLSIDISTRSFMSTIFAIADWFHPFITNTLDLFISNSLQSSPVGASATLLSVSTSRVWRAMLCCCSALTKLNCIAHCLYEMLLYVHTASFSLSPFTSIIV